MKLDGYGVKPLKWEEETDGEGQLNALAATTDLGTYEVERFDPSEEDEVPNCWGAVKYGFDDVATVIGDFAFVSDLEAMKACWQHHCDAVLAMLTKETTDDE